MDDAKLNEGSTEMPRTC